MNKYLILFLSTTIIASIILFLISYNSKKPYGNVIILNGPSASGKSSIQREFQSLMMPNLWLKLGIDNLFDQPLPDITPKNISFWQKPNPIRWIETTHNNEKQQLITLFTGKEGNKVALAMNSAIADYAKEGCNIIVDYIAYKKEWLNDLNKKLIDINTYWIKVNIPLEVLEQREETRATSPKGHARSHYDYVHWDIKYNLEFNTANDKAIDIAKKIKNSLLNMKN